MPGELWFSPNPTMNFKYLIVEHEGMPVPILFSSLIKHRDLASALDRPVISAGHVRLAPSGETIFVQTYGEAGSLQMKPRDDDEVLICEDSHRFGDQLRELFGS